MSPRIFDTTTERKLPKVDLLNLWRAVRWSVMATVFVVGTYYSVTTKLKANDEKIESNQREITNLQSVTKSKESAAADRELILNKLDEMDRRYTETLKSIDQRLNRIENRRR